MKVSKSVSQLLSSGGFLLSIKRQGERTVFGVFDIRENGLRFSQTIPSTRANAWSISDCEKLLACAGWEDGMISTFDAVGGRVGVGFRVVNDASVLIFEKKIRVADASAVHVFNLHGEKTGMHRFRGCLIRDVGRYCISKDGTRFLLLNEIGKEIAEYSPCGLGLTSAVSLAEGLAISENRGPVTVFDKEGRIDWQKFPPEGYHPVSIAVGAENRIFAVHARLSDMASSMLCVYDFDGKLVAEQRLDRLASVRAFSPALPGWVFGDLSACVFDVGAFEEMIFDELRSAFFIEY